MLLSGACLMVLGIAPAVHHFMRIVIAPDSFKECASAAEVAAALARGWLRACPDAELRVIPMADGGEGTVAALVSATAGRMETLEVTGPLGERVRAAYGVLGDGHTAVIEMAAASGLALVPVEWRDPRVTTTRGTGELIAHALDAGARRIIVGIGGSATNDGGAGMAQALGYRLLDALGNELPPGGAALHDLTTIDARGRHVRLDACEILVACDVTNPLCGPLGASVVYGPQKGATPEAVDELDGALRHFADVIRGQLGADVIDVPGAGAAGGLGAGLLAFAGARLRPGVALVAEACGLEEAIAVADLVLTGEGRIDAQSAFGKTPTGVAQIAAAHGVPVVAVAGAIGEGFEAVYEHGICAVFGITRAPQSLEKAYACTETALEETAEAVARLWGAARERAGN